MAAPPADFMEATQILCGLMAAMMLCGLMSAHIGHRIVRLGRAWLLVDKALDEQRARRCTLPATLRQANAQNGPIAAMDAISLSCSSFGMSRNHFTMWCGWRVRT